MLKFFHADELIIYLLKPEKIKYNIFLIIMRVSQNVSIRWEMNFYDKNTC